MILDRRRDRTMGFLSQVSPPAEGTRLQQNDVTIFVERESFGKGTLYIAESEVCWVNSSGQGCTLPYPAISLHAVSKDLSAFPHQCLYLMVDGTLMSEIQEVGKEGEGGGGDDGVVRTEEEEQQMGAVREVRFVPDNSEDLRSMFDAMSDCQELHPDPEDEDSGEEYDDAEGEEGDEAIDDEDHHGNPNQGVVIVPELNGNTATTDQSNNEAMDTGQFDDADDMEPDH